MALDVWHSSSPVRCRPSRKVVKSKKRGDNVDRQPIGEQRTLEDAVRADRTLCRMMMMGAVTPRYAQLQGSQFRQLQVRPEAIPARSCTRERTGKDSAAVGCGIVSI